MPARRHTPRTYDLSTFHDSVGVNANLALFVHVPTGKVPKPRQPGASATGTLDVTYQRSWSPV